VVVLRLSRSPIPTQDDTARKGLVSEDADSNLIADRIRIMTGRALRIGSRIVFGVCGLGSLLTAVPYALLRGIDLPIQSEWVIFAAALGLPGIFSLTASLLPLRWIAKACKRDLDDEGLVYLPFKVVGGFAAIGYLAAVFAQFAPHTWNLNSQIMLGLCPMYFVRMTIDPSPAAIFLLLAPMNSAVYGSLGVALGYAGLALPGRKAR